MSENYPNQEDIVIFHSDQERREYGYKLITEINSIEKTHTIELSQMFERSSKESPSHDLYKTSFVPNLSQQFIQNEKLMRLLREQCIYLGFPTSYNNYHSHRNNIEVE